MNPADTTCAAIKAVPTTAGQVTGTTHQFTPSSTTQPLAQTQAGADYVTFLGLYAGPYTLDPIPPSANWMFARPCWTNETTGATGEGLSQTLVQNQILRWDIGYTLGTAWVQTQGADVYAAGSVRSYIPAVTPRVFMADGTGRSAGVLQYGTSYDFDSSPYAVGNNLVSSGNWQVSGTKTTVDYYDYFYRRYGAPTVPTTNAAFSNLSAVTKPASSATPYYIVGNMTTSGNWVVGTGESVVILVNGNLTIGGKINTTGTGFIAFIVNGNITVDSAVGTVPSAPTTPVTNSVLDGVYVTNPTGTFSTGLSTALSTAQLVAQGSFVAGNFLLQRDLDGLGGNANYPAEYFAYDPQILLTMPDPMKELPVKWQEVAP